MRLPLCILAGTLLMTASCTENTTTTESTTKDSAALTAPSGGITITDLPASPEYPDAELGIKGMTGTVVGDSVKLSFSFDVKNFELKAQTGDAGTKQCNNSKDGQHIHFILNNKPYVALYEPKHEVTVAKGTDNYLMCFLSRSYHESVKSGKAGVLAHFRVDDKGGIQKIDSALPPMVFYSRPKGDYLGADTQNVLLDFYPTNVALGTDYKVKADIKNETNGRTGSFTFDVWAPHFINGLGTGNATVMLTLVDKNGNPIQGQNTSITRNIKLAAAEPMK
jgi:hypothetical protein